MKRSFKYLGILLAFILVLTGCGKSNSSDTKSDARSKLKAALEKDYTSLHEKVVVDMSMTNEGQEQKISLTVDADEINNEKDEKYVGHLNYNVNYSGFGAQGELYYDVNKNSVGIYGSAMNKWFKYVTNMPDETYNSFKEELEKSKKDMSVDEILNYTSEIKEVTSDKDGYELIEVTVSKDKLNEEYKKEIEEAKGKIDAGTVDFTKEDIDEINNYFKNGILSKDLNLKFYLKDGNLAYFEYDMTDMINNVLDAMDMQKQEVKEGIESFKQMNFNAKISVEMSNFNGVADIVVPESVKSSAQDLETILSEYLESTTTETLPFLN